MALLEDVLLWTQGLCNHMQATHQDFVAAFPRDHPDVPPIVNVKLATKPAPFADMWERLLAEDKPRWSPISKVSPLTERSCI